MAASPAMHVEVREWSRCDACSMFVPRRLCRIAVLQPGPVQHAVDVYLLSNGDLVRSESCLPLNAPRPLLISSQRLYLGPDYDGPSVQEEEEPEVDLREYAKAVDVSTGSSPTCAKFRGLAAGLARGCPSANNVRV